MSIFKIQNAKGEFVKPGIYGNYTKQGKVWQKFCFVEAHLKLQYGHTITQYKNDGCEIVEYEIVEVARYSIDDVMSVIDEKTKIREQKRKEKYEAWTKQMELNQLKLLQEKYKNEQ